MTMFLAVMERGVSQVKHDFMPKYSRMSVHDTGQIYTPTILMPLAMYNMVILRAGSLIS